jgi:uncharacterized protein
MLSQLAARAAPDLGCLAMEIVMAVSNRAAKSAGRIVLFAAFVVAAMAPGRAHAQAQEPYAVPQARIIVSGEGDVRAAPDFARITVGATTQAATAKAATDANSHTMIAVEAALRDAGIAPNDIQTANFSVQPVYASTQSSSPPKISGFAVTNQVAVTVRQIDKVGDVLDRAIAAGANDVGGVQFLHADLSKTLDAARTAALADAKRKAALYARAAGLTLGAVSWVVEDQATMPQPRVFAARMAPSPVPIAAGEDTLSMHITVGFDVAH